MTTTPERPAHCPSRLGGGPGHDGPYACALGLDHEGWHADKVPGYRGSTTWDSSDSRAYEVSTDAEPTQLLQPLMSYMDCPWRFRVPQDGGSVFVQCEQDRPHDRNHRGHLDGQLYTWHETDAASFHADTITVGQVLDDAAEPTQVLQHLTDDAAAETADDAEAQRTGGTFAAKYLPGRTPPPCFSQYQPAPDRPLQNCIHDQDHDGPHEGATFNEIGDAWAWYETTNQGWIIGDDSTGPDDPSARALAAAQREAAETRMFPPSDVLPAALTINAVIPLGYDQHFMVDLAGGAPDVPFPVVPRPARDQLIATLRYAIEMLEGQE